MRSWAQPTADDISRVQALAARPENRAYFFDRLENPLWVVPLADAGFFADPPAPVPAGEPGYVRFPPWPEGRYLARVASSAAEPVAAVLRGVPRSENPTVTRHVLEAVGALDDPGLRAVSARIGNWLEGPFVVHFADEAVAVVVRLFQIGEVDAGLAATAILLAVQPDPRLAEKAAIADAPLRQHPEAAARMSDWHYERVLERLVVAVVDGADMDGLRLLASLLDDGLRLSRWADEAPNDFSYIWRPAIEEHAQNSDSGITNALVSATRDAGLQLAARSEDDLIAVVRELEAGSLLHRRIALYVLALSGGAASLVSESIGNRSLFDEHRVKHEFALLLKRRLRDADDGTQARLLSWIAEGPDLDFYRRRREEFDGSPPSDADVQRYARTWRRDWLSFVAEYLTGEEAVQFGELVAELGEPEHPDFVSWSSSWSGPESPLSRDELLGRQVDDVIEYLRSWRPDDDSGWHFGPSMEGLGRIFAEVVKERAADYAAVADRLVGLDPTYVRSFFSGLDNALRDGGAFAWDRPLALAGFVVDQSFEGDEEVPDRDRDPGWRWSRREVGSILRSGFADREHRIPFRLRQDAWRIVSRLASDPNPSPDHEQRYGGDNMDPLTLSINTNRGTAMHAVVEYALWTRRELEAAGQDISVGFDAMPEVRDVLETHLDPAIDPSLAVRSVYGRWLPWLLLLDQPWVVSHLASIVPAAPQLSALRDAVWSTYISWCPPYDSAFRVLRAQYDAAIQGVPTAAAAGTFGRESVDAKLAEHLVTFFWRGVADLALLDEFFDRADDELASDVMEFVGRALHNTEGEVADSIRERIQELWDRRLAVAEADGDAHKLEARAFGMSFASAKLDHEWALPRLERAVSIAGAPHLGHWVAERLVEVAASEPAAVTRIFVSMLAHPENEWDHFGWRDEARAIVSRVAEVDDPAVTESCAAIVDFYVRRGELDFRELLAPRPRE